MTDEIEVIFNKNYMQHSVNVPLMKEEDMDLVFKKKRNCYIGSIVYLYKQYFYSFIEKIPKNLFYKTDNNQEYVDFYSCEPTKESLLSLNYDYLDDTIPSTILTEHDDCYYLYSMIDHYNNHTSTIFNNYMNYNDYYIVSSCVDGYEYYDLVSKNKLFYFPEKACLSFFEFSNVPFFTNIFGSTKNNIQNHNFDRIENVKYYEYELGQIARENAIDPVDHAFEEYEKLEEKIQENTYNIEEYLKIFNDSSVPNRKDYLDKINKTTNDLSSKLDILEQWRQIMLAY